MFQMLSSGLSPALEFSLLNRPTTFSFKNLHPWNGSGFGMSLLIQKSIFSYGLSIMRRLPHESIWLLEEYSWKPPAPGANRCRKQQFTYLGTAQRLFLYGRSWFHNIFIPNSLIQTWKLGSVVMERQLMSLLLHHCPGNPFLRSLFGVYGWTVTNLYFKTHPTFETSSPQQKPHSWIYK